MNMRKAKQAYSEKLTEIAFSSKKYLNYPDHFFEIWNDELSITPKYILRNHVFLIESSDIIGFYSIVIGKKKTSKSSLGSGTWLDHVFISPEYIGKGYEKLLMDHFIAQSEIQNWLKINILANPNSSKFYEKLGAEYIKEVPLNIKNRTVQYLVWNLSSKG